MEKSFLQLILILIKLMFAEKSVIFNFCEILFQIKDDLYKQFDDRDGVINRVCLL